MEKHNNRPFFIDGFKDGELVLNIPKGDDYSHGCNLGRAGFYDYVRAEYEADEGLLMDGLLQCIVLDFARREHALSETEKGFIVGFFSELEDASILFNKVTVDSIKKYRLNDAELSPLSCRPPETNGGRA